MPRPSCFWPFIIIVLLLHLCNITWIYWRLILSLIPRDLGHNTFGLNLGHINRDGCDLLYRRCITFRAYWWAYGTIQTSVGAVGKIADEIPIPFYCIALTDFPFEIKNAYSSAFVILIIVPSPFCSRWHGDPWGESSCAFSRVSYNLWEALKENGKCIDHQRHHVVVGHHR